MSQVEGVAKVVRATVLVMPTLDGTAGCGILVANGEKSALPVHFIRVGDVRYDPEPFQPRDFAHASAGKDGDAANTGNA